MLAVLSPAADDTRFSSDGARCRPLTATAPGKLSLRQTAAVRANGLRKPCRKQVQLVAASAAAAAAGDAAGQPTPVSNPMPCTMTSAF